MLAYILAPELSLNIMPVPQSPGSGWKPLIAKVASPARSSHSRVRNDCAPVMNGRGATCCRQGHGWQRHQETRAAGGGLFQPHLTAVHQRHTTHDRKTQPEAASVPVAARVQPMKR